FNVGSGTPIGIVTMSGGTIQSGTVQENVGAGLAASGASTWLDWRRLRCRFDLSGTSSRARIFNGLTLLTETGTPGVANVIGSGRSEERRVGKECENRRARERREKKKGKLGNDGTGRLRMGSGVLGQGNGNIG